MNGKAFRCGTLALLLTAAVALPAGATVHGSRSTRPAVERGWWATVGDLTLRFLGWGGLPDFRGAGGPAHLSGANRGGIDPNGTPPAPPDPTTTTTTTDPGDNRGGIDPNG